MAETTTSTSATASPAPADNKEMRRQKQRRKMSKILTKAWELPHARHFQESARSATSNNNNNNNNTTVMVVYDLRTIGAKIDDASYKLGRHGWEDFARDLAGVYHRPIARASKHARHAKEHLEQAIQWLNHIDESLGRIASEYTTTTDADGGGGGFGTKRKSSEGHQHDEQGEQKVVVSSSMHKKKKTKSSNNGNNDGGGVPMTAEEREEIAMESLAKFIEDKGGSRKQIEGYTCKANPRSDGRFDVSFFNTHGKRMRSMLEVARTLNLVEDDGDPHHHMSKKKMKTTKKRRVSIKKRIPSNKREYENETKKLRRELEKLVRNHRKATKALDDFENERNESRYPVDDDILMEEEQQQQDNCSLTPTCCPAARIPDIPGYAGVPSHCIPDVVMTWDFLCTFGRALSLNPILLDDFVEALTYQPSQFEMEGDGVNPSTASPPVFIAEAHLSLLKLLLQDKSSDEWWWSILETDEAGQEDTEVVVENSIMMDVRHPVIKVDMEALLEEPEDPLITTSWLHVLEGVRDHRASEIGPIRKAVRQAMGLVTNKWVRAYLKKSLQQWKGVSADFTKRAILWLLDHMRQARPDFWGENVKKDQLRARKQRVIDEAAVAMAKMEDSGDMVAVEEDDVGVESDDEEMESDESDDEEDAAGATKEHREGLTQTTSNDVADESTLPATSTIPIRPPPTLVDLLLPPAKPLPGSDSLVSSFTWPQLAGATIWRILHRYKKLRNEVDDSLRERLELGPMTVAERRQREAKVAMRCLTECAEDGTDGDPSERAAVHLCAGRDYLELSVVERLCVLRLLIEAAYDSVRVNDVVDDNFRSRINAVKALDTEMRRAKREAREEAAAAESAAREKLAAEARTKFLEDKREEIETSNMETKEYTDEFIDGLTDEDIIEFDEEIKAEYEALPGPESFNKTQVNEMVARIQEENAFNTHAVSVLTLEEIVFLEKRELENMEEQLASYGDVESFSLDRETSKTIDRLRRNIKDAKYNAEFLPHVRNEAIEALKDAIQDGTLKTLRAAMRQAKQAELTGPDEDSGGVWTLDLLRDAALELKAAESKKRIIDARKDLVQKRNKCFIRTEPIGQDRFRNRFWHFGHDEEGRIWAEADYVVKSAESDNNGEGKAGFVDLVANATDIAVGAEDNEEDFVNPEMTDDEKSKFLRFSRQEYHREGQVPCLAKKHWGCHATEKSLRSLIKNLDGRGTRELELKTNLKEALEGGLSSSSEATEVKQDHSTTNGQTVEKVSKSDDASSRAKSEFSTSGDQEALNSVKKSVDLEEYPVVSLDLLADVSSAIGESVRVRKVIEETRDRSVAHYRVGKIDAWKLNKGEVEEDAEDGEKQEEVMVPEWRVTFERGGGEAWLSGNELLDSLCRFRKWKKVDIGYFEEDAAFLAYRNSTGRHCGKAADAAISSSPMFLARLMVRREQDLYFSLKNRTFDNNWGGKNGTRNAWTTSMKDYCFDFRTVRNGLLTLEQAFFELTGGAPEDDSQEEPVDARKLLSDETSLFETELESIDKNTVGLWNSRESRAIFRQIVESSKTTGVLALALDLLYRNCRAYLDRTQQYAEPRRSGGVVTSAPRRTTRRMNAWQRANEEWY